MGEAAGVGVGVGVELVGAGETGNGVMVGYGVVLAGHGLGAAHIQRIPHQTPGLFTL